MNRHVNVNVGVVIADLGYVGDPLYRSARRDPRSGLAHFELGCLYDQADPAAAIYHYEQYLKLAPKGPLAAGNGVYPTAPSFPFPLFVGTKNPFWEGTFHTALFVLFVETVLSHAKQLWRWAQGRGYLKVGAVRLANPAAALEAAQAAARSRILMFGLVMVL